LKQTAFNAQAILAALKQVLPSDRARIGLHEPEFHGAEWSYLKDCLDTGYVSSVGHYVDRFEDRLAQLTGARHAIAVVNGTAALHASLRLIDIGANDEVLLPALTFAATANAIAYCGAIPHFVDNDERSLGVDSRKLEDYLRAIAVMDGDSCRNRVTGRPIRALIVVHTFGHPADIDPLNELCRRFHLVLVEDAAQSLGSLYKGRHAGTFGSLAALSFNGNKIVTTGGGGAILTDDEALARRAKHITTTARIPHPWRYMHDELGYNYRMPNINAALGCAQLEQLDGFVDRKRSLFSRYLQAFADISGARIFAEPDYARSNYWLNLLLLDPDQAAHREDLLELTHKNGILTRPAWVLLHRLSMYAQAPRMDLSTAESLENRLISLPSSAFLNNH
jgi:perosamine synthetase